MSTLTNKALLSITDFRNAARTLGLREIAPIRTVAQVEGAGKAFLADGRTPILFIL